MSTSPAEPLPTCRCGRTRRHPNVNAVPRWGLWGWFLLLNGASATPRKVAYRCTRCHQLFDETRDPETLEGFR